MQHLAQTQYSVHTPSPFIQTHLHKLLPDWSRPAASVLVILQPCSDDLRQRTPDSESQKQLLRLRFLTFGYQLAANLQQMGHLVELFDPQTGLPLLSHSGQLRLDDVAIVRSCLGYPTLQSHGCSLILHPTWGSSVYPSTLLSTATPTEVESLLSRMDRL